MFYILQKRKKKSSPKFIYMMEQFWHHKNMAGNSIKFKCSALTLKYWKGFIEEPDECRQISLVRLNVHFIKILCKVFKDGLGNDEDSNSASLGQ